MFTKANFLLAFSFITLVASATGIGYYTVKGLKAYDKFVDNIGSKE